MDQGRDPVHDIQRVFRHGQGSHRQGLQVLDGQNVFEVRTGGNNYRQQFYFWSFQFIFLDSDSILPRARDTSPAWTSLQTTWVGTATPGGHSGETVTPRRKSTSLHPAPALSPGQFFMK